MIVYMKGFHIFHLRSKSGIKHDDWCITLQEKVDSSFISDKEFGIFSYYMGFLYVVVKLLEDCFMMKSSVL